MPSQEPIHLFVYGTLTDPERVAAVTGKQFQQVEATLGGFERVNSPLGYPFILPSHGAVICGALLLDIDPASLVLLDAYEDEGRLYRRQPVMVEVAAHQVPAMTYVGHAICTTVARTETPRTDAAQRQVGPGIGTPAGRRRTSCADEH
jgi:gamma-glutamylcyclotransferase (GGCT)/AIG2-like uncharacterized protein YtfP